MNKINEKEIWVDNVKVIACILVVLGHFFQSMVKANIISDNDLYEWFNQTIYYFHVPLFFVCSGYLYQKFSSVNTIQSWGKNIFKKGIVLGIPYFLFSLITWILKNFFSGAVNEQAVGLIDTLLIHPSAPYWYLYALFFIFLITPTFLNKKMMFVGLMVAILAKIIILINNVTIPVISYILENEIWFVGGMSISVLNLTTKDFFCRNAKSASWVLCSFVVLSIIIYYFNIDLIGLDFILGLMACIAIIMLLRCAFISNYQTRIFGILAKYTLPIYLMHTIFAAAFRTILMKVGIDNFVIQIVLGLGVSFLGPIITAVIMKKSKYLEFFLYPGKFIRFN